VIVDPFDVIPDSEIAGRIERLQALMAEKGVAALICFGAHRDYAPADLWYLARWSCIDEEMSYVFVPPEGETTLVTDAEWDEERARDEAFTGSVIFDRLPAGALAKLVRTHADAGARIGISGLGVFPAPVYLALAAELDGYDLVEGTQLTERQRTVKSPLELGLMREAARISDLGMRAGIEGAKAGATEAEIAAHAESAIRFAGAEISFTTIVGSGSRTALTTFLPSARRPETHDIVVLDCGARVSGYHGDMCRAIVIGGPDPDQRHMLEAVAAGVRAGSAAAHPGVAVGSVHHAARNAVAGAGYGDAFWGYYMPHGAGAAQHEMPLGLAHEDMLLEPGMVLCIEPGHAIPGVGGIVLEQMIHVGAEGPEVLNALPIELWET
jgi:Xaa-Pro aminopeptidase